MRDLRIWVPRGIRNHSRRLFAPRNGGQKGATVDNLRGTTGADFEHLVTVERRAAFSLFGGTVSENNACVGLTTLAGLTFRLPQKDEQVLLLMKGPFCFIFKNEKAPSPKYAISLTGLDAKVKESTKEKVSVALETNLGDEEYLLTFSATNDADVGKKFVSAVKKQAAAGQAELVRKVRSKDYRSETGCVIETEKLTDHRCVML